MNATHEAALGLTVDSRVVAPDHLDPETQIEWNTWVGRRVWVRAGIIGVVVTVMRKPSRDQNIILIESPRDTEARTKNRMEGKEWLAGIDWSDKDGAAHRDVRDLSWLRSVDKCLDTRGSPEGVSWRWS